VLNVPKETNKIILKADLEKKYKVKVLAINIVNSPKKKKAYRGRLGLRGGGKKAYITLKAGDSIVI
jgi:ribosomal protein L23